MTPYAILTCKPTDPDEVVRRAYHKLAEVNHPDRNGGKAATEWFTATGAYNAVKTALLRSEWAHRQELLAGLCDRCAGSGVIGTRMFKGKIRLCEECKGEGRLC